jgi:hypothetical protein
MPLYKNIGQIDAVVRNGFINNPWGFKIKGAAGDALVF